MIAILVEALVGACKSNTKWEWFTMGAGAVLCALVQADLFAALDMPIMLIGADWAGALAGQILTGAIVSRGADYLLALWSRVTGRGY
jgi:hypothetical protein